MTPNRRQYAERCRVPLRLNGLVWQLGILLLLWACQSQGEEGAGTRVTLPPPVNTVRGVPLEKSTFAQELYSNGKVVAMRAVALRTQQQGTLVRLAMTNGQEVRKGDTLARLHNPAVEEQFYQAKAAYELSLLDLEDLLLVRGYSIADTAQAPAEVLAMAQLRSNFSSSQSQYRLAKQQRDQLWVVAPIPGTLGSVVAVEGEVQPVGSKLGAIYNLNAMGVRFQVLEEELAQVQLGQNLVVKPLARPDTLFGRLTHIDPKLNEYGLSEVEGLLQATPDWLREGMNAEITLLEAIPNQWVVPKNAVVQRQGQNVVFLYKQGHAEWVYVEILHENRRLFAIRADPGRAGELAPGDTVICEGNLYLGHQTPVKLVP